MPWFNSLCNVVRIELHESLSETNLDGYHWVRWCRCIKRPRLFCCPPHLEGLELARPRSEPGCWLGRWWRLLPDGVHLKLMWCCRFERRLLVWPGLSRPSFAGAGCELSWISASTAAVWQPEERKMLTLWQKFDSPHLDWPKKQGCDPYDFLLPGYI